MSLAWLRLMQARVASSGGDPYVRDRSGKRVRHPDGGWKMKALAELSAQLLPPTDPRSANLAFFTGLRNVIEHRYEKDIASLVAGRTQAHVLNYERTVTEWFGLDQGLADQLRFPIFLSSITTDAVAALKAVRKRVPRGVLDWVQDFDVALDPAISADQSFDFHVYLVPHSGPKSTADAAMSFVLLDELDEHQLATLSQVQTIIRDKQVPVANLDRHKPTEVAAQVSKLLGQQFTVNDHTNSWKYYGVRPANGDAKPAATKSQFCLYDATFRQYVYTDAWIKYLVRHLSDSSTYAKVLGRPSA